MSYREGSVRSGVWKLRAASGDYFLKLHAELRKWHPEVYAYHNWVNAIRPSVPELVAVIEGEGYQGVLITALEGQPLRDRELPLAQVLAVYREAGELARRMHDSTVGSWFGVPRADGQPYGKSWDDPVAFMKAEFDFWCGKLLQPSSDLDERERALAHWMLDRLDVYAGECPIPIHRDYQPINWLVDEAGQFTGVIDFECMQWSLRIDPFFSLWSKHFRQTPGVEEAFCSGYGRNIALENPEQYRVFKVHVGLCTLQYGTALGDAQMLQTGHAMLREIMDDERR
ncbi:MAG TPA: aminoglycoside phosphotransferase family protein [Armatimonadota bacterium]|nr:aminoglycoside phosphotransferase family protein [Armatimonadota bacterium]